MERMLFLFLIILFPLSIGDSFKIKVMKKSFFEREDRKCLDLAYKTGKINTYWNCMDSGGWDFNSINLNDSWSERKKDSFKKSFHDKDRDFCKSLALKIFKADRYFS